MPNSTKQATVSRTEEVISLCDISCICERKYFQGEFPASNKMLLMPLDYFQGSQINVSFSPARAPRLCVKRRDSAIAHFSPLPSAARGARCLLRLEKQMCPRRVTAFRRSIIANTTDLYTLRLSAKNYGKRDVNVTFILAVDENIVGIDRIYVCVRLNETETLNCCKKVIFECRNTFFFMMHTGMHL